MKKRVLYIPIERKWFEMIARGLKPWEYRAIKKHWRTRIEGREYDEVLLHCGYGPDVPKMRLAWKGYKIRKADPRYAPAEFKNTDFYAIDVTSVIEILNWKDANC